MPRHGTQPPRTRAPYRPSAGLVMPCPFMIWDLCSHAPLPGLPCLPDQASQAPASCRSSLQLLLAHRGHFSTSPRERHRIGILPYRSAFPSRQQAGEDRTLSSSPSPDLWTHRSHTGKAWRMNSWVCVSTTLTLLTHRFPKIDCSGPPLSQDNPAGPNLDLRASLSAGRLVRSVNSTSLSVCIFFSLSLFPLFHSKMLSV